MTHSLSSHGLYLCAHYAFKVYKCYMLKLLQNSNVPQSSRQKWREKGLACRSCRESKMKTCTMVLYKDAIWLLNGGWENAQLEFAQLECIFKIENFKDIHPLMSCLSSTNYVLPSNQTINNKKYLIGEVKLSACSKCTLQSQCTDPQFLTLTLGKEFSAPTE